MSSKLQPFLWKNYSQPCHCWNPAARRLWSRATSQAKYVPVSFLKEEGRPAPSPGTLWLPSLQKSEPTLRSKINASHVPPPKTMSHFYKRKANGFLSWKIGKAQSHLTYLLTGSPEIHVLWHHKGLCLKREKWFAIERSIRCKRRERYWRVRRWSRCRGRMMFTVPRVDQGVPGYNEGRRKGGKRLSPCFKEASAPCPGSVWWSMSVSLPHSPQHSGMSHMWETSPLEW